MEGNVSSPSLVIATTKEEEISSPLTEPKISTTNTSSSLSPTSKCETPTRSKSLVSAPPSLTEKTVTERNYSFNLSQSADGTRAADVNTRQ